MAGHHEKRGAEKMRKLKYPNPPQERPRKEQTEQEPDFIPGTSSVCPNYEKYKGWEPEEVLVWLNID